MIGRYSESSIILEPAYFPIPIAACITIHFIQVNRVYAQLATPPAFCSSVSRGTWYLQVVCGLSFPGLYPLKIINSLSSFS